MKSKVTKKSMLGNRLRVVFKSINCILFVLFCTLAGYFLLNVIDQYQAKKTNLAQSLEPITKLPTIVLCLSSQSWIYGQNINISYEVGSFWLDILEAGKQYHLEEANEIVQLVQFSEKCLKINSTLTSSFKQGDERYFHISTHQLNDSEKIQATFYFSSEENSNGFFVYDWLEGIVFEQNVIIGHHVEVRIKQHEFKYMKDTNNCSEESNFQRWKKLMLNTSSEELIQECNVTCTPYQFLSDEIPLCGWKDTEAEARDCTEWYFINNWWHLKNEVGYKMPCTSLDYSGKMTYFDAEYGEPNSTLFGYKFSTPMMTTVNEEYLIFDMVGLIGSVGGTLGMCVGFSFSGVSNTILDFIENRLRFYF